MVINDGLFDQVAAKAREVGLEAAIEAALSSSDRSDEDASPLPYVLAALRGGQSIIYRPNRLFLLSFLY